MIRAAYPLVLVAAASAPARAEPALCPTAPSTLAFDLGSYHGSAWITDADGRAAFAGGTRFDCPASTGLHAWQSCNFSVCDLPDGDYGLRFSRMKPPAEIAFTLSGGKLRLAPTELAVQAGNYGIDATGSRVAVTFDLRGYDLPWSLEAWPPPAFHGTDTATAARPRARSSPSRCIPQHPTRFASATGPAPSSRRFRRRAPCGATRRQPARPPAALCKTTASSCAPRN
ncbi:MAG: hypothetical protein WDN04_05830 [Rhodospirillales bacterium]